MKIILKITGNDKPMALDDIKKITAVKNSDGSRFVVSTPSVASFAPNYTYIFSGRGTIIVPSGKIDYLVLT